MGLSSAHNGAISPPHFYYHDSVFGLMAARYAKGRRGKEGSRIQKISPLFLLFFCSPPILLTIGSHLALHTQLASPSPPFCMGMESSFKATCQAEPSSPSLPPFQRKKRREKRDKGQISRLLFFNPPFSSFPPLPSPSKQRRKASWGQILKYLSLPTFLAPEGGDFDDGRERHKIARLKSDPDFSPSKLRHQKRGSHDVSRPKFCR